MPKRPSDVRYAEMKGQEAAGGSVLLSCDTMRLLCEEATEGQYSFVRDLLAHEYDVRAANKLARLLRQAQLPTHKDFDGFSWDGVRFPADFDRDEMLTCDFVRRRENLVLYGGVGNGKSHTAVALSEMACSQGMGVRFFATSDLVLRLKTAAGDGTLARLIQQVSKLDLLVCDEWGYLPTDPDGAKLLFQVVSACYERVSIVLTTNIEFSRWGSIFNDENMAAAMLDRIVHHGRLVTYERDSYRMQHALMQQREAV